jgi:hypothetical protein
MSSATALAQPPIAPIPPNGAVGEGEKAAASVQSASSVVPSARPPSHVWRKLAAIVLVVSSLTLGIVGLGLSTSGNLWGLLLIAVTPFGIWLATRVTPEAGTTGYFDKNI